MKSMSTPDDGLTTCDDMEIVNYLSYMIYIKFAPESNGEEDYTLNSLDLLKVIQQI